MSTVLAKLPTEMREEFKEPLGEIYTDADALMTAAGRPIVTVGDIVTYRLVEAGYHPNVAIVDGKTKRERVGQDVLAVVEAFDSRIDVANPQSTITDSLIEAITTALERSDAGDGTTVIVVDGEEDLASLPAVLATPEGGTVVYGQPDEGMVLVPVDADTRGRCRELLERMQGSPDRIDGILSS